MTEGQAGTRRIALYVGLVCEAGRHLACEGAHDNMGAEGWPEIAVWVCACECHPREGDFNAR